MPDSRMIRVGILTSDSVNKLTFAGEVFFRRLMSLADDYGRFDGRVPVLRAALFALKLEFVSEQDIAGWIAECRAVRLLIAYEVAGRPFLQIEKFGQRIQGKSKWPAPPEEGEMGTALPGEQPWIPVVHGEPQGSTASRDARAVGVGVGVGVGVDTPKTPKGAGGGDRFPETEAAGGEDPPRPVPGLNGHPTALLAAWNAIGLTQAVQLTGGRQKAAGARLREPFFRDNYPAGLERVAKSAFCRGQNDRQWKADFDWFLRPDTLPKILEGKYDDKTPGANRHPITGKPLPPSA